MSSEKSTLLGDDDGDHHHSFEPDYGQTYRTMRGGLSINGFVKGYEPMEEVTSELRYRSGVTLAWNNIEVTAPEKSVGLFKKQVMPSTRILKNISGMVESGSMVAIMGASGSGKTTLLNVLTGRIGDEVDVTGQVLLNGSPAADRLEYLSGYIQQEDVFVGTLTVEEHLWFTAKLRMPSYATDEERTMRVEESIQELGLARCRNTVIGVPNLLKGISGGEKKRLALASELLNNPLIMFADEPTSGLDSFMAASVVECLINLAKKGKTILCTIHQPASDVYAMFPQILLLSEGQTVYMGKTSKLPGLFADAGYTIPSGYNPADFVIKNLAIIPGKEDECRARVDKIVEIYNESSQQKKIQFYLESLTRKDQFQLEMEKIEEESQGRDYKRMMSITNNIDRNYSANFATRFGMLCWRNKQGLARNKKIIPSRVLQIMLTGVLLGFVFFDQVYNQTGISNINGAIFMLLVQVSFNSCFTIAVSFIQEYPVLKKEHRDRMYCVFSFYLSKVLIDLPPLMFASFIYATVVYWMVGFEDDGWTYFLFSLGVVLMGMVAVAFGHMGGSLIPNPTLCLAFLPLVLGIFLLFSGFLVREDTLLWIFYPLLYISPYRYSFTGLMILQWKDVNYISCTYSTNYEDWYDIQNSTKSTSGCYNNGYDVLKDYGYNPEELDYVFFVVLAIFFAAELIGYCSLAYKVAPKKK